MTVGLSMFEQRLLTEIEQDLRTDDPRLARCFAEWSDNPGWSGGPHATVRGRRLRWAAATALSAALLLAGLTLLEGWSAAVITTFGVVGALACVAVEASVMCRSTRRDAARHHPDRWVDGHRDETGQDADDAGGINPRWWDTGWVWWGIW